jgi:DNA polymerase-1
VNIVVGRAPGGVVLTPENGAPYIVSEADFPAEVQRLEVQRLEVQHPRWVWDDTARWYPLLLVAGVRIERCVDLRLSHAILRTSALTSSSRLARAPINAWDRPAVEPAQTETDALFDLSELEAGPPAGPGPAKDPATDQARDQDQNQDLERNETPIAAPDLASPGAADADADPVVEWLLQQESIASAAEPGRIQRLLAAESAGALIAAEMRFAGMPWRPDIHDQILTASLGPRPRAGERPARLSALLDEMRALLEVPDLNPDSPAELVKGLARGGVLAPSTRSWDLKKIQHAAIPPLLEYKKLSRLASANGWHWVDTWVRDGRFRPDYVVGGVVTGRWATSGGGALQLPKQIRGAAVADDGWKLVVADAAQLEPRILAAMAGDRSMAEAGAAGDLYAGIVASGAIDTREHAKTALLGAMYGATQGEGGRLLPQLARAYPRAIAMVEDAARAGERGESVTTRLGRSSPLPGAEWRALQAEAYGEGATEAAASRARAQARGWGRFTRNFIVQGTAAEWALCWMASLRNRLTAMGGENWFTSAPHLVFFLHDEVVVHTPADLAERVAEEVRLAAADAGRLLFGPLPVDFPLTVATVDNYGQAK